ncbi:hypothetical protein ACE6H2_019876 [Prunus campanulata]
MLVFQLCYFISYGQTNIDNAKEIKKLFNVDNGKAKRNAVDSEGWTKVCKDNGRTLE